MLGKLYALRIKLKQNLQCEESFKETNYPLKLCIGSYGTAQFELDADVHCICEQNYTFRMYTTRNAPSCETCEPTVHAYASLVTGYKHKILACIKSSCRCVKRVTRKYVHLSILALYGISVASITASFVYLLTIAYHALY